jgi:hypothetical protein
VLYEPDRHEPLNATSWDPERVHAAIARIAQAAVAERRADGRWPAHPLDVEKDDAGPWTGLYLGAAGTVWGLATLHRRGLADVPAELCSGARLVAAYRAAPDDRGEGPASLLLGETGVLLVQELLAPSGRGRALLLAHVRGNRDNPAQELLWGSPGTMLAAHVLHQHTSDEIWAAAWRESADRLWQTWERDDEIGCHLWTQELDGRRRRIVGAGHGQVGTIAVLRRGAALLPGDRRAQLHQRAVELAHALARREDGLANWPPDADGDDAPRVQWCHGAPGIVTSLGTIALADAGFTALLSEGGELVWAAGPLAKGAGLCHGTAGNGYTFLRLFARTGDRHWLARARAFAMHAIGQVERAREAYAQGRHGLWTGDVGTALYLAGCLQGDPGWPTLDTW